MYTGANIVRDGLVFGYDADDRSSRFYKGEPTTNLITNPTGKNITPGYSIPGTYKPGWDNSLHTDAILVNNWSGGYNSGVGSPAIGYHAKWVYGGVDGKDDPCMFFQDENSVFGQTHRWLGISSSGIILTSIGISTGDSVTISWMQKSSILGKGANVGIYHKLISAGSYSFEDDIMVMYTNNIGIWEKKSFTFTITSNWDLSSYVIIYVYGNAGAEGKLWVDNVQLEEKSHATQFILSSRPTTNSLIDLTKTNTIDLSNISFDSTAHPYFNGTSNHIIIPGIPKLVNYYTISAWIHITAHSTDANIGQIIIQQYGGNYGWIFSLKGSGGSYLQIRNHYNGASMAYNLSYTTSLNLNTWYFVNVTDDGTIVKLYVNGNVVATKASSVASSYAGNVYIGSFGGSPNTFFNGKIISVNMHNRPLSDDEILQNYNASKSRFSI